MTSNFDAGAPNRASDAKNWIIAIHVTYLIGFGIVGVIIAYVKRPDFAGTPWESHLTYAIRTFWIGVIGLVVGIVLTLVLIGLLIIWAVAIWVMVRAVIGLVRAINEEPIKNPESWLI